MKKLLEAGLIQAMNTFVHVIDTGSFTSAASQMDMNTAQVSRLIKDLEARLQIKLMQRSTRRLALTEAGERYLEHCRQVIELVAKAEEIAAGSDAEPNGRLRVLVMASFGARYIAPLLSEFCVTYPRIRVEYRTSQEAPDLLADGADMSVYLSHSLPDSMMVARRIGSVHSIFVASPAYLSTSAEISHPRDLRTHPCLRLVNPSLDAMWALTGKHETFSFMPDGPLVSDVPEAVVNAALRGVGVALLPAYSTLDHLLNGALVHVLPDWKSTDVGVYALTPSRKFVDAKTREWLELLARELPLALEKDMTELKRTGSDVKVRAAA
ncbi:DNA-binding transcriptional LysR family regulator [Paraburkholderia sp. GAS199]|uniref:LysR family transcriptional regulator n=1 Tax=Paraburkholderia sp. GAS199 TaxID=3035126 RepID=UPI003D1EB48F